MFDIETYLADKEIALYFVGFILAVGLLILLYRWAKDVYLTRRFFYISSVIVVLFTASYFIDILFNIAQAGLAFLALVTLVDILLLFAQKHILKLRRNLPKVFSLGLGFYPPTPFSKGECLCTACTIQSQPQISRTTASSNAFSKEPTMTWPHDF